jgi:ABC-type bacteriocin/lantibiotic exporter with double-glycine peptidase domain
MKSKIRLPKFVLTKSKLKISIVIKVIRMSTGYVFGIGSIVTGLTLFAIELMFAISLQRFLGASGLLSEKMPTRFFGEVQSVSYEALMLAFLGSARLLVIWVNGVMNGYCQVYYEAEAKKTIGEIATSNSKITTGESTYLLNDVSLAVGAVVSTIFYSTGRIVMLVAALASLLYYAPVVTLIILGFSILFIPLNHRIDKKIKINSKELQANSIVSNSLITNTVRNIFFIQLHDLSRQQSISINSNISKVRSNFTTYYRISGLKIAIPQALALLSLVLIGSLADTSFFDSKSEIIAYLYLVIRFFQIASDLTRVSANLKLNAPKLNYFFKWAVEQNQSRKPIEINCSDIENEFHSKDKIMSIELERVNFSWTLNERLIDNLTYSFKIGQLTTIIGQSGRGKTTLLKLLSGLINPQSGSLTYKTDVGVLSVDEFRSSYVSKLAYVGPNTQLFQGSIRSNLTYGLAKIPNDREILIALEQAKCDFVNQALAGLDFQVSDSAMEFSTGEIQRLALARAILRQPDILLLDEPTSNLDVDSESHIMQTLQGIKNSMIIVCVTHGDSIQKISDSIIKLGK